MDFKQSLLLTLIPAAFAMIFPIINYLEISKIESSIKDTSNTAGSLDLYNALIPNISFSIGQMALSISAVPTEEFKDIKTLKKEQLLFKDLMKNVLLGEYSTAEKIGLFEDIQVQIGGKKEDIISVIIIEYCVENHGKSELHIPTPQFSLISTSTEGTSFRKLNPYESTPIGGIFPGRKYCSDFKVKYSDFTIGDIQYSSKITARPTKRSLEFIFPKKSDKEIQEYADIFSYEYTIKGTERALDSVLDIDIDNLY